MYLYDASQPSQSTVAPVYTKLIQNDSFSIFVNNNATTNSNTQAATSVPSSHCLIQEPFESSLFIQNPTSGRLNSNSNNITTTEKNSSSISVNASSVKLDLTNAITSQVAKNPLLKFR